MAAPRRSTRFEVVPGGRDGKVPEVGDPTDDELDKLLAELVLDAEVDYGEHGFASPWAYLDDEHEALLAAGIPIALPYGDMLPEQVDESLSVEEAAEINIEVLRLRSYMRRLSPLDRKVICLIWGIGCRPHTLRAAAARTGLTPVGAREAVRRGLHALRILYGVSGSEAA